MSLRAILISFSGGSSGAAYFDALSRYSRNGVVVFASSNNDSRSHAGLMTGLPRLFPELEASWVAVVNAVPAMSGGKVSSAIRISSACLETAAWCITADGTVYGAVATGNTDYQVGTGTSFAAPQVSGAIALLAEAFPDLSAQELRARLLASADNGFFDHTGFVEFSPGVDHGFNDEFGHGFLDLKAALLPIGGAFVPVKSGRAVPAGRPVVVSGGMAGNSVTTELAKHNLVIIDGLGGGFSSPANILAADASVVHDPLVKLGNLMDTDLNSDQTDPFNIISAFASDLNGRELNLDLQEASLSVLMPQENDQFGNYGIAITRKFSGNGIGYSLGISAMHETGRFAGLQSVGKDRSFSGTHAGINFGMTMPLGSHSQFSLSGGVGMGEPDGGSADLVVSSVTYNSLGVSYGIRDLFGAGDRFSIGVNLPQAIESGSTKIPVPVAFSKGVAQFETIDVDLSPTARQVDISMNYGVPMSDNSEMLLSLTHSLNDGNIEGVRSREAAIGFKFKF